MVELGGQDSDDSVDCFVHPNVIRSRLGYSIFRLVDQIADKFHFLITVTGHGIIRCTVAYGSDDV